MFRVPEGLPDDVAVLTEIFAVTHSLERAAQLPSPAGFRPGSSVAVIGVGALGLAHAIKASLMGAGRVIAVDPRAAGSTLAARLAGAEPAVAAEVRELTGGEGVDLVVNATGFPGSFAQAVEMVRDGGLMIEVGAFVDMGEEPFNPAVLCGRNLTMLGIGGEDLLVYEGTLALLARHHRASRSPRWSRTASAVGTRPRRWQTALDAERSAKVLITAGMTHPGSTSAAARALVTGSSRGIGLALARRARRGGLLGRAARRDDAGTLERARGELRGGGGSTMSRSTSPTARRSTPASRRSRRSSGRSTSSSTTRACSTARRCSSSPTTRGTA